MKRLSIMTKAVLSVALATSVFVAAYSAMALYTTNFSVATSYEEDPDTIIKMKEAGDAVGELLEKCIFEDSVSQLEFQEVNSLGIDYYAKSGDVEITNTGIRDVEEYRNFPVSRCLESRAVFLGEASEDVEDDDYGRMLNQSGYEEFIYYDGGVYGVETSIFLNGENEYGTYGSETYDSMRLRTRDYTIYVKLTDEAYAEGASEWTRLHNEGARYFTSAIAAGVVAVICYVALLIFAGERREDGSIKTYPIDDSWSELRLIVMVLPGVLLLLLGIAAMDYDAFVSYPAIGVGISLSCSVAALLSAAMGMSLVRNLKGREFWDKFLFVRILRFFWRMIKRLCRKLLKLKTELMSETAKRYHTGVAIGITAGYSLVLIAFTALPFVSTNEFFIIIPLALAVLGCKFFYDRIKGFAAVCDGVERIRAGETEVKIADCPDGIMKKLSEDINDISEGLKNAVDREVRAERMKSELITNVSHDLKTPLTSIINYTDLLCREQLIPAEANDYAAIISKKAQQLKNLTADLFDISKVQSGSDIPELERLDICLLINQTLGELNESITSSGLEFVRRLPEEEIFVMGDGRKLSRVFENLFVNCLKYSLENTRVYVSLEKHDGKVRIEIKNISKTPLDFDAEEITERFVRGDASRSTEGSGLGLAIAKSYTEVCGGTFKITIDGDLFKATVCFDMCE